MIYVYPYNKYSASAKLLVNHLDGRLIKLSNSKYKWNKPTINWGGKDPKGPCLNFDTSFARDKIKTFQAFKDYGVRHPPWTTDKDEALSWVNKGKTVFARSNCGQGGSGIKILNDHPDTNTPLYVEYIKKKYEFRYHIFNDEIIHAQEKKLKNGHNPNKIRSHTNGYIFGLPNELHQSAYETVKRAVRSCNLIFGAVDVIYNEHKDEFYVLEVNTAPGLSEKTAGIYVNAFKTYFN